MSYHGDRVSPAFFGPKGCWISSLASEARQIVICEIRRDHQAQERQLSAIGKRLDSIDSVTQICSTMPRATGTDSKNGYGHGRPAAPGTNGAKPMKQKLHRMAILAWHDAASFQLLMFRQSAGDHKRYEASHLCGNARIGKGRSARC